MDLSEFIVDSQRPYALCSVQWALMSFTKEQVEKAKAALQHPGITSKKIAEVFTTWSPERKVATASVVRHRRGECRCE
jgi:hypothetical protein